MLNQLIHILTQNKQRCLLWVKGEQSWAELQIQSWLSQIEHPLDTVWFGETLVNKSPVNSHTNPHRKSENVHHKERAQNRTQNQNTDVRIKQYQKMLGQESDVLVYDAYAGLNSDALGALVGTIKQGGVCILISPDVPKWLNYVDPEYSRLCVEPYQPEQISHYYIQHFVNQLLLSSQVLSIGQDDTHSPEQILQNWCDAAFTSEDESDKYRQELKERYRQNQNIETLVNSPAPVSTYLHTPVGTNLLHSYYKTCRTEEQYQLVQQLFELSQNNERPSDPKPLNTQITNKQAAVLQSDRGRGKSSSLGLFAGLVLAYCQQQKQVLNIILTAPHSTSVSGVFHFCETILKQQNIAYRIDKNTLKTEFGSLNFVAPDELVHSIDNANIVLVDEAAAIPSQMLLPLLSERNTQYGLVVFSTTIHGYEGTGRGFEYKFKPMLDKALCKVFDGVTNLSLTQPIRWSVDDFLEQDINQLLMINAQPSLLNFTNKSIINSDNVSFNLLTAKELINQSDRLNELFGLLVNAHYRTTPNDLRNMLDGPNMKIFSLEHQGEIVGAILLAEEGKLEPELAEQIWQGRRRPKGHLLPQSLITHSGFKQAGDYRYGRVVRIAIHPELQNQGLGSLMLDKAKQALTKESFDFICTSFGIADNLVKFWLTNQLAPVRLGLKAEASSGEYSLLMAQSLNQKSQKLQQLITTRFHQTSLVEQALNMRSGLSKSLLSQVIQGNESDIGKYTEQDKQDLICFSYHHRSLDTCLLAMFRFIKAYPQVSISPLVLDKVNGKLSNKELIKKYDLTGEKQLTTMFRNEWKMLI
jgi:tRNA(Met) cytidine acetyltransferase